MYTIYFHQQYFPILWHKQYNPRTYQPLTEYPINSVHQLAHLTPSWADHDCQLWDSEGQWLLHIRAWDVPMWSLPTMDFTYVWQKENHLVDMCWVSNSENYQWACMFLAPLRSDMMSHVGAALNEEWFFRALFSKGFWPFSSQTWTCGELWIFPHESRWVSHLCPLRNCGTHRRMGLEELTRRPATGRCSSYFHMTIYRWSMMINDDQNLTIYRFIWFYHIVNNLVKPIS